MKHVQLFRDDHVTKVVLSPLKEFNANNPRMHEEFDAAFNDFADDTAQLT
ncbi:enoyl-CoA hydratase/carnithine racemase [Erythromicrobium ramosum]|uniref:Enoyl-CoA hydratase/carnithine racemase n=1 Tax=Erythrobacter ramosus TaxID=35811 RepID=A0ABR6I201_9SPHN|nr:hypothetical protein [Erythrobacter ramosus]MBB3776914.1 enoyl-CoA hydratase/carnithine racemase [Erythrobacter ramosus]